MRAIFHFDMKQFYTYLHCKPDGTPFYVGKGCDRGRYKRSHKLNCRGLHHKNIVTKYGRKNIGIFVFHCISESQALADEMQQISQLRREGYALCNISDGGDQPPSMLGRKLSPETCAKMSTARMGNKNSLGKKLPPFTVDHRAKIAASMIGNKHSSGIKRPPFSAEHLAKLAAATTGKQYHLCKFMTFNGITDSYIGWSKRTGINIKTIYQRISRNGWSIEKTLTEGAIPCK